MNKPYAGMVGEKVEDALAEALNKLEEMREIAEQEFQKHLDDPRFHAILHSFDAAGYALQHGRALLRQEPFTDQTKNQAIASMEAARELALKCKRG